MLEFAKERTGISMLPIEERSQRLRITSHGCFLYWQARGVSSGGARVLSYEEGQAADEKLHEMRTWKVETHRSLLMADG